jgi:hypothetical protein
MRDLAECEVNVISGGVSSPLDDWAAEPAAVPLPVVQDANFEDEDGSNERHPPALGWTPVK